MGSYYDDESALVPTGINDLQRIGNSLKVTSKLIQFKKIESVTIGGQEWMLKNLNVSTFRNGDLIPEIQDDNDWEIAGKEGQPAWCYYNDDFEYGKSYGKLYNWHAVNDLRGLAPDEWRVPKAEDVHVLVNYLGGFDIAGNKLKAIIDVPEVPPINPNSTSLMENGTFSSLNAERIEELNKMKGEINLRMHKNIRDEILEFRQGSNESGFTGLLGGFRHPVEGYDGVWLCSRLERAGVFWCSNSESDLESWNFTLGSSCDDVGLFSGSKSWGFSVRCIKSASR